MPDEEVTIDKALLWLSLPRTLGQHPESGEDVVAAKGRYGPYLSCGTETRTLPKEDDIYTVASSARWRSSPSPRKAAAVARGPARCSRSLGTDGDGKKVELLDGFYGPYLTNGDLNAGLPKGTDIGGADRRRG